MPMIANAISVEALITLPTPNSEGTASTNITAAAISVHLIVTTHSWLARCAGSGRTSSAPRQLLVVSLSLRDVLLRWASRATNIAPAMIG